MARFRIALSLLVIIFILFMCGCATFMEYGKLEKSARQDYKLGNYDQAVFNCVQALKIKPGYGKAQTLVKDAYAAAVRSHEGRIKELNGSSGRLRWDETVSEYEALTELNRAIESLPALVDSGTGERISFQVTDYSQSLGDARTNAAEAHYQEGDALFKREGMDSQKQAAKEFKAAESFCPGYKDAAVRYETARRAGIKRIAIVPFQDKTGKEGQYGSLSDMIVDQVIGEVIKDPESMEFLEIISRDQLALVLDEQDLGRSGIVDEKSAVDLGAVLGVHEIVTGKINQIIYTPPADLTRDERRESREVVRKEKYTDTDGKVKEKDVYGQVYVTVHIHTRKCSASIAGSYQIIDAKTAKLKKSESFSETGEFQCVWATYSGDARALTRADKALAGMAEEIAPVEEEMVNRAATKLAVSLAEALKDYAR